MSEVREYVDQSGRSPYAIWFNHLNAQAAAKVATAVTRVAAGNFSNVKGVGSGVFEYRIDFGPGYRIYFGGTKSRQQDVSAAISRWQEYKRRKPEDG